MPDTETLDERLRAVERTLTDTDQELTGLAEVADLTTRIDDIETRLDDIEGRLTELEASTQAVRGYVGNVRSVDREVEQRADLALAKVEELEQRLHGESDRQHDRTRRVQSESGEPARTDRDGPIGRSARGQGESDERPRWTGGDGSGQRTPATERSQRATAPRNTADREDDQESETDEGGFLAGLTDSL